MSDLSWIKEREELQPKTGDEPLWQRLRLGVYLGYRPSKKKAGGTWLAGTYDPDPAAIAASRWRIPLIRARLPILTVAQLSGTSVAMIEKHYGRLVRDNAEEALATLMV